jgi:hypothetical protein
VIATVAGPPGSATVGLLGGTWIAAGTSGGPSPGTQDGPAVAWTSSDRTRWSSQGTLDPQPGVLTESPTAICNNSTTAVVVGDAAQSRSGTSAASWYSSTGIHWKQATISPSAPPGATEWMQGCTATDSGFAGFGATVSSAGSLVPAVWTSTDGTRWTLQDSGALGRDAPAPITALAASGSHWIAVAGSGEVSASGDSAGSAPAPEAAPFGAALLYPRSESATAVWVSGDAGSSWQRVDEGDPVWAAAAGTSIDQAAFAGSTAVVAGLAYGRLEVWTGTPSL